MDEAKCLKAIQEKLDEANNLMQKCITDLNVETGKAKLIRRIESEIKFLNKLRECPVKVRDENLACSNLTHLSTLVTCALGQSNVAAVLQPFPYTLADGTISRIVVDVVADHGLTWLKVVARNPQAVLQMSLGEGEFGRRTLPEQLRDLVACSEQHTYLYQAVQVKVFFSAGSLIGPLRQLLAGTGTQLLEDSGCPLPAPSPSPPVPLDAPLNLDVSCMLTFVSSLANGRCHLRFTDELLTEQARREVMNPVKPVLDALFLGRSLMCTQCALQDFLAILDTVGGFHEKERASQLISRLRVVPDQTSERALTLEIKSKVKLRPRIIFGTGDTYKAVTVTSNGGFLRAALAQGVKFAAFVHESRALTESKEHLAVPCNFTELLE